MEPGQTVGGRYRIVERIGRGGHGEVYRAQQLPLGRDVALKVLLPDAWAGDSPERFAREASLVQALDHPNTVRLFDFGVDEHGLPFMVFELLRGRTLEEEIAKGPLEPDRVARIATQVLKALMDAHARGIVHRDIKPSNVFLVDFAGEPDFVKVLDFGVARRAIDGTTQRKITSDGQIVGTPSYMAPEQVKDGAIGPKTDLYALGLVIAEALSGKTVVDGATEAEIWMKQASPAPVEIPSRVLASAFGPVVSSATKKEPAERPGSAEEMLRAIDAVMTMGAGPTDPLATPITPQIRPPITPPIRPPPPPPSSSSSWTRWAIGLVVAAGVLMLLIVGRSYRNVVRATRSPNLESTSVGPKRASPPPAPLPVVEVLASHGWKSSKPPQPITMPFFVVNPYVFEKNGRMLHVNVYDFDEEHQAVSEEGRRRESQPDYAVRRRGRRLVVVDSDNHAEGRAIAAQLLP